MNPLNPDKKQNQAADSHHHQAIADGFIDDDTQFYIDEEANDVSDLCFDDAESTARIGDPLSASEIERQQPPKRAREAGLTAASHPGDGATEDDLSPEMLIAEDGANSPEEPGQGAPNDRTFKRVSANEIGGGSGLDEAELARVDPLDKTGKANAAGNNTSGNSMAGDNKARNSTAGNSTAEKSTAENRAAGDSTATDEKPRGGQAWDGGQQSR